MRASNNNDNRWYFHINTIATYRLSPHSSHIPAHTRENEGEKPWPKPVGLQRAGRILWPADGWVNRRLIAGECWMICLQIKKEERFNMQSWWSGSSPVQLTSGGFEMSQPVRQSSHPHDEKELFLMCFYGCFPVARHLKFISKFIPSLSYFNFQLPW